MGTVYPRGDKLWIGYKDDAGRWRYAATEHRVGEEPQARRVLAKIEARLVAAARVGEGAPGPLTVSRYAKTWLADRRARHLSDVDSDAGRLKHVERALGDMPLEAVRPRHIRELVRSLRARSGSDTHQLAPRTVRHIYGVAHTLFADAVAEELIESNPCVLKKGDLPKKIDKDPTWRIGAVFTREEVERILTDPRVPGDRRVVYALLFLGGLRFGETAALRWRSYDPTARPLGRLLVAVSYNTKKRVEKSVKSEAPRQVPVHPALARLLADWKQKGWGAMMAREPKAEDLIVPSREGRNRNVNHMLRRFHQDLTRLGMRRRRQHDARRTFISLARTDGARADVLECVTHGPRGDIVSLYTTLPWELLCAEVGKLRVLAVEDRPQRPPRRARSRLSAGFYYGPYYGPAKRRESHQKVGGADGARTRGLRRDRPAL